MRIIGGTSAGAIIKVPKGLGVRPTPDKVRLAIFNSLAGFAEDARVLEVFAGDRRYMAQRIYPTSPEAVEVRLFSRGGHTLFKRLSVWKMGGDLRRQEGA